MADVDLSVEVRAQGIRDAVAQLEDLRKTGMDAGMALSLVQSRFERGMAASQKFAQAQRGTKDSIGDSAAAVQGLRNGLEGLEAEYRKIATLSPKLTAIQRLTQFGGANGLAGGIRSAKQMEAYNNALSASPIRDRITAERQLAEVQDARASRLTAVAGRERANWEAGLAGMGRQQEAQARLTRATQEYATAQAQFRAAPRVTAAAQRDPEEEARRLRAQAAAIDAVTAARQRLTTAEADVASANEARLQQSYGYFILAGLATQVAQNIFAVGQASLSSSMTIERSFADVERTFEGTDDQLESLRSKLVELSTSTPNSLVDLQGIATLGNQLGIAAEDIQQFTEVIAQYTAVSGQSAEDSATAFGRISNLTGLAASQYGNLASAITYTARTTVATESTIQNTAKEISALSAGAGFSAQAIVGLAGALSSLAIPPERARGALSLYFGALNSAVAEGGPKLQAFAQLTNLSADSLNQMVRENRGQEVFTAFISGLSELDTVAKTTALDTLGLSTIRVDQTMRALAQNVPLVTSSFEGANSAFAAGTEIGNQYNIIQETLNSRWIEFQNAILNVTSAVGDEFAPAAKITLDILINLLEIGREMSTSPLGQAFLKLAGFATILIGALAAGVGVFALARASLVVLSYTVAQMGWTTASAGLAGWIAQLVSSDKATRAAAISQLGFRTSLDVTTGAITRQTVAARAGVVAFNVLKVALPILAITAAVALFTELAGAISRAVDPSQTLSDDLTGLKDALTADNQSLLAKDVSDIGNSTAQVNPKLSEFNQAIVAAIAVQQQAEAALGGTNNAIDAQAFKLGEASKAWIAEALKSQRDIADIIDGQEGGLGPSDGSADAIISREQFLAFVNSGLDVNAIAQTAATQGKEAALVQYEAMRKAYLETNPGAEAVDAVNGFGALVLPGILDSVIDSYGEAAVSAALAGTALKENGTVVVSTAADYNELGEYIGDANANGEAAIVTFSGLTGQLSAFRDSIQGAIAGYVGFDSVMARAKDTADALAASQSDSSGTSIDAMPVDVTGFSAALASSITDATAYFNNITALADTGATSLALQLSALGPEASGILAQSLALDPASRATLEGNARFAAFLVSDAFKNQLNSEMADSNEAYAQILNAGGTLADVQSLIAAQVSGDGKTAEMQWVLDHPEFSLNLTPNLTNPTPEALALYASQLSGAIVITPTVAAAPNGQPIDAQKVEDGLNGANVTISAGLDGNALAASLDIWKDNQNATPEELEALINTKGFNKDIDAWVAAHGPITVYANLVPRKNLNVPSPGYGYDGKPLKQQGGLINERDVRGYANGGIIQGPGTNTSDSVWLKASMGERIFAADRERFWGHDFMDSLDKKMLPAQFMTMLGGAAVSGNSGGPRANVSVNLINPTTRDPLKQLRQSSEMIAAGIFGDED